LNAAFVVVAALAAIGFLKAGRTYGDGKCAHSNRLSKLLRMLWNTIALGRLYFVKIARNQQYTAVSRSTSFSATF
jgi:hypothetical protein